MTVFRNRFRGNRWRYDFRLGGKRYQGWCTDAETGEDAKTKAQARECEALVKREVRGAARVVRPIVQSGTYVLAQAIDAHIESQVDSTPEHVANLELYAREILDFFGPATPVTAIDAEAVGRYRNFAARQKLKVWAGGPRKRADTKPELIARYTKTSSKTRSAQSANHYLDCLRGALGEAHRAKDPITGQPMLPFPPDVAPLSVPRRQPRPMPDAELYARLEVAPPWVADAAELARHFGLRLTEALTVTRDHIDRERKALRFDGRHTKSGRDEWAQPIPGGWAVLARLERQALARGQRHLVTWPGPSFWRVFLAGDPVPAKAWRPLKRIRRSWRTSARAAGIETPHRLHDVRARYITEVAKVASSALTQEAARHSDPVTTQRYTAIAGAELSAALRNVPAVRKPALPPMRRKAGQKRPVGVR